jgi:tripartite-type tricarboxylate transporter receptor subunit TctC
VVRDVRAGGHAEGCHRAPEREINKAIADPDVRRTLGEQGVEFTGGTPEYADQFVRSEIDRWGKIIKTRGMSGN